MHTVEGNEVLKLDNSIHLSPKEFSRDKITYKVAKAVAASAEKRRAEYRKNEKPILGLLGGTYYYSETVPWYEWMEETDVLGSCADSIGMSMVELSSAIATRIQPPNWKVFALMALVFKMGESGRSLVMYRKKVEAEREAKRKAASKAGKNSGRTRRDNAKARLDKVINTRDKLVKEGTPKREIADMLAKIYGVTPGYIRTLLKSAEKRH